MRASFVEPRRDTDAHEYGPPDIWAGPKQSMSNQQLLYEAKLTRVGRRPFNACVIFLPACIAAGVVLCRHRIYDPLVFIAFAAAYFIWMMMRGIRLWKNAGVYRVLIDDYGLYVHSDDPESHSFTVVATDIRRLARKTIKGSDSGDEHEYYIETKAGARHRLGQHYCNLGLNPMHLFETIADRFHWVEIEEEVEVE